jgi:YegS/Rv2252/BmrU family lipid kinase
MNPAAGNGRVLKKRAEILSEISKYSESYIVMETTRPMEAKEFAAKACADGSECIICIGGDGTISEVISGMLYSGVPLGIVPMGSGNDLIKSLNMDKDDTCANYIKQIFEGKAKAIDVIKANDFYSVNITSVGFDAEVVKSADKIKKIFGGMSYFVAVLLNVFKFKSFKATIHIDDMKINDLITLVSCGGGKYYGGGFKMIPSAEIDDGLLSVCIVKNFSKFAKLLLFPLVIFGWHTKLKNVEIHNCKKLIVEVESGRELNLNVDGNLYKSSSPFVFEVLESAVKILI